MPTVFASRPMKHPQQEPVCAVLRFTGRSTASRPYGRTLVQTACRKVYYGREIAEHSLTDRGPDLTCERCWEVLLNGGWELWPPGGRCVGCAQSPTEGHASSCGFVRLWGLQRGPDGRPRTEGPH